MGYGSQILHMIFFIIFMLISFHFTHILFPGASFNAAAYPNVQSLQEGIQENHHHIRKVSRENKGLIFEKFRTLLGLKSFKIRKELYFRAEFGYGSPSLSPIEAPVPAPAPVLPLHVHSHHSPSPRPRVRAPVRKVHKEERENSRGKRTLVAVLVSASAAFVLCGIGLIWGCQEFQKRRRRRSTSSVAIIHSTEGGSRSKSKYVVTSQNSVKKVTSDPGPDLFYLDSIETALEPQQFSVKQHCETVNNASSNQNTPVGYSSRFSDRVTPEEDHSSDDESFHSFCNSHSSNARLSNASAGTLSDSSEIVSPYVSNVPTGSMTSSLNNQVSSPAPVLNSLSYPPPPPPTPPLLIRTHISPSHTMSNSTRTESKALSSSALPILSSPRNSDSSSGSNQTPRGDLPPSPSNPLKAPLGIPLPPCPPPFTKGNGNPLKGPPPPPSPLPQHTPLGKDGVPLPKLKPLHWDKVRAAPDHSMVWDKLRSSPFEFDEEMIESLFGYNLKNSMKNDDTKSKSPSPSKHVLEPKRRKMGVDLVSGLATELFNVKKTVTIDLDVIASSVSNLSDAMTKLQHLVNKDLSKEEKSGNFVQSMRSFLDYAERNLKELQEDEHRVLLHVRETTEYFHGHVSKDEVNPLRIFVIVRDFLGMLDHVCKELRSLKVPSSPNPLAPFL